MNIEQVLNESKIEIVEKLACKTYTFEKLNR